MQAFKYLPMDNKPPKLGLETVCYVFYKSAYYYYYNVLLFLVEHRAFTIGEYPRGLYLRILVLFLKVISYNINCSF